MDSADIQRTSFLLVVTGGAVGLVFLAVSKVTEEAFGYGDSMVIGVLGIYLGFWNLLSMLVLTFILAAMTAMFVLTKQKFHRSFFHLFLFWHAAIS